MSTTEAITRSTTDDAAERPQSANSLPAAEAAEVEILVEEISIDGMCGVY